MQFLPLPSGRTPFLSLGAGRTRRALTTPRTWSLPRLETLRQRGCRRRRSRPAVFAYNHNASYVEQVLALADQYGQATGGSSPGDEAGFIAAQWALAQVGTPYVWGGETVGVGFDCSGLVQAAYVAAGVDLPRVAQSQFEAGVQLADGTVLVVGDLVFFGGGPDALSRRNIRR